MYTIESSFSGKSASKAYPWRGPARANRAAEYARKGSESVDPTRSLRVKKSFNRFSCLSNSIRLTSSMGGSIATFVVTVKGNVETEILSQAVIVTIT